MGDTSEMWKPPFPPGWNPYVNQLDPRVGRIEEICQAAVGELRKQGLTDSRDAFLEAHTWEIMKRIQDPELKKVSCDGRISRGIDASKWERAGL